MMMAVGGACFRVGLHRLEMASPGQGTSRTKQLASPVAYSRVVNVLHRGPHLFPD